MKDPLTGYRILDFSKLLPGPLATRWMAEQGAEVIKVESPNSPDPVRFYPPLKDGVSVYHTLLNTGKKSLSVDYREAEGRDSIIKLVDSVDVVVEQFRPGVMQKFGLGYEELKAMNESIIYVSLTGYGQDGEMAQTPGHDINYLAYSGVLDGLRDSDGNPIIPSAQIADVAGGSMMLLNAVTLALLHRERTGEGQRIDLSMAKNVAALQSMRIAEVAAGQDQGLLSGRLACYNIYKCKDGRHVALGALEPKFWQKFCNLLEKPEWGGRVMEENLVKEVGAIFKSRSMRDWVDILENEDVCLSPVLTLKEASEHPLFSATFPTEMGCRELGSVPELGHHNDLFL